jgi:hypothetical protein
LVKVFCIEFREISIKEVKEEEERKISEWLKVFVYG